VVFGLIEPLTFHNNSLVPRQRYLSWGSGIGHWFSKVSKRSACKIV